MIKYKIIKVKSIRDEYKYVEEVLKEERSKWRGRIQSSGERDGKMVDTLQVFDSKGNEHIFTFYLDFAPWNGEKVDVEDYFKQQVDTSGKK